MNETKVGPKPSVTLSRLYKDDKGAWKDSDSFDPSDLPTLALVAQQAYLWLSEKRSQGELPGEEQSATEG
jgi:hypothetical protein